MPTRKIADIPEAPPSQYVHEKVKPCYHREHEPPSHMVFQPGIYEHECPSCGNVITFTVRKAFCGYVADPI